MRLLEQTMRWYGPSDPVSLRDIRQAGASGVVSALHHIPNGNIWTIPEIQFRKKAIEAAGLKWSVVESLPVHEHIKTRNGKWQKYLENYQKSLENLGACGLQTICYNFMPLLDWTRTQLDYLLPDGSRALRYEKNAVLAFDLFILNRKNAADDYNTEEIKAAGDYFDSLDESGRDHLSENILKGLPGAEVGFSLEEFRQELAGYDGMDHKILASHLDAFLAEVTPVAEANDMVMCIHPDDPPFRIFGLPRVVSTAADVRRILKGTDRYANGLTFCTGSFGVRADNDLPAMVREFGDRIHFIHLRSTKRDAQGNFFEADHLDGDVPMFDVMRELILWQQKRERALPMRPDHGHQMLEDLDKTTYPGYTAIGRLKGLAELRGLELGIAKSLYPL